MILGPRIVYSVDYHPLLERRPDASGRGHYVPIERIVPGVEAQGWVAGRWYRAHRIEVPSVASGWQVTVALHSAWRFCEEWRGAILGERRVGCDEVVDAVFADQHREWLLGYGRQLLDDAVRRGEVLPHVLDLAAPFQVAFSAWTATRPWALMTSRPGCLAGDTELVVNRRRKAFRITLRELVYKFNGGVTGDGRGRDRGLWVPEFDTYTQSIGDNSTRVLNRVVCAVASGVKPVLHIRTVGGREIKATGDHRFLGNGSWILARDLLPGTAITVVEQDGKSPWKPEDKRVWKKKLQYREVRGMGAHPYAQRKSDGRCIAWVHRLVAEARLNDLPYETFVARIRNGNVEGLTFLDPKTHHVHHRDRNTLNNAPDNLEVLLQHDHLKEHGDASHWTHVNKRTKWDVVKSIEPAGEEETFDLTMETPMNNFVANGFVVHNSGKTLSALLALSARPLATTLVVCPAAARKEWRVGGNRARRMPSSVERFTTMETHVVLPVGERRKGYEELPQYLSRMREEGKRQVVVVGMESLPDHLDEVKAFAPSVVIIDEIHKLGDSHRHDVVVSEDGTPSFHAARSEAGGVRRSVAAMQVSRMPSLQLRVGLSGTPLDDGKTRRLWAPLDLLSPGGFGAFGSSYKHRFCGFRIDESGFPDDSASTHVVDDLRPRCAFLLFDVPRSESHGSRKLRLEVDYLDASRLGKPDAMVREMQRLSREAAKGGVASKMAMREANLAYACSMKKPTVLSRAKEFLEGNMKVMIFVSRRAMADAWGDVLRKTGAEGWVAHGDMGSAECDRLVEMYATAEGAAWLVGTWDAIGESKNGMQGTHLGVVAQLPVKPSQWIQGIGRWDRMDGVGTIVWVPVAEGTQDDKEIARLVRKFGPITQFLESPELREAGDALEALDDDALGDSVVAKILKGGVRDEDGEEE